MQTSESRRRWLAIFPPLAIALLAVGQALTPPGLDRPITSVDGALKELQIAAAHSGRLYLASLLVILGLGALGVSFAAIATLTRGRGAAIGTVAAVVGGLACFCGVIVNVLIGLDLAGAATADSGREAAAQVLVSTNTAFVSTALLVAYLGGVAIAVVLTGIALWRSGTVHRWVAVVFPVSVVLAAAAPPGPIAVLMHVPVAVVMVLLAVQIWDAGVSVTRPTSMAPAGMSAG